MGVEALVIVAEHNDIDDAWDRLRHRVRVTQTLPPRLALVVADDPALATLPDVPGITVHVAEPPDTTGWREDEQLFVRAWQARRQGKGKTRAGDGLPWDAAGFTPPDAPHPETPSRPENPR